MWQTDISIDKRYYLNNVIRQYLHNIDINYQQANIDNRDVFSVKEEDIDKRNDLNNVIKRLLLYDLKYQYIDNKLIFDYLNKEEKLLFAEMLFFDNVYEKDVLDDILPYQYEYSLDGIFNFKMSDIKSNWNYLIDLFNKVHGKSNEVISLAKYIHASSINPRIQLYLIKKNNATYIFEIDRGHDVKSGVLSDNSIEQLFTIISKHACKLFIDKGLRFDIDTDLLSNVIDIKFI